MTELFLALVTVFVVDRLSKAAAFRNPEPPATPRLCGVLTILPTRNPRPWPWPAGGPGVWAAALLLALASSVALLHLDPWADRWSWIGLGAALGGAAGNLYDRIRHGAVLDFLSVGIGGVFNLADLALLLGLGSFVVSHLLAVPEILSRSPSQ